MTSEEPCADTYCELVDAANRFLFTALPLRRVASRRALRTFAAGVHRSGLSPANVEPVLVRTLAVLTSQARGWLPSLVDRYLIASSFPGNVAAFEQCVVELIRHRGIDDPAVEAAIAVLESQFRDCGLEPAIVAAQSGLQLDELRCRFTTATGLTIARYLRGVRLDEAAQLLNTSISSIKEIWTRVGYNHHANFCHEFQRRFGLSPTEYRERANSATMTSEAHRLPESSAAAAVMTTKSSVLVVDDDIAFGATTADLFSRAGYRASTAKDATGCVAAVQQSRVDAIVLDYRLGRDDGLDVLRALRQLSCRPPVVLFSADSSVELHASEVWRLGATILFKLTDFDNLERVVRRLCAMPV